MTDDTISRQAAIDALGEEPLVWHEDDAGEVAERNQWRRDVAAIKALPSAQPTGTNTVQVEDCISRAAVLDEIHKYMEERDYTIGTLYDNICEMPSAQPVNIAKLQPNCNQVASHCASDCASHCASDVISRQAAIETVRKAKDKSEAHRMLVQLPSAQPGWIPCSERLPEYDAPALLSTAWGKTEIGWWTQRGWMIVPASYREFKQDAIVAWMPLPKPWKGQ